MPASSWVRTKLRACLFDFGGTLDADGVAWQDRFFQLYTRHGMRPDRERFRRAFYHADDTLTETRALEGLGFRETVEEQARRVWKALEWDEPESKLRAVIDDFIGGTVQSMDRNRKVLDALCGTFLLGMVSNFYGNLEPVCEELGIRRFFGCLIDSNQVGVVKPDPRIFQAALDRLGVRADETVFVGDNVSRDMEGARDLGMPHVLLVGPGPGSRAPCCPGDPVIHSLEGLLPLLLNGTKGSHGTGE